MVHHRRRRLSSLLRVVAAAVTLSLLALPALAQVTPEDVAKAERAVREVREELREVVERYEAALTRQAELESSVAILTADVAETEAWVSDTRERLQARAVELYIGAAGSQVSTLLLSASPTDVEAAIGYLRELGVNENELLRDLQVAKEELDRKRSELEGAHQLQAEVSAELESLVAELNTKLEAAQAEYGGVLAQLRAQEEAARRERERRAAEEAARRAATSTSSTSTTAGEQGGEEAPATTTTTTATAGGGSARYCPVQGVVVFTDTFGAPRSGGRSHQGVDMLAARGTPVVAIDEGTVSRMSTSSLGGITVWFRDAAGDEYYYAHLDGWAPGQAEGQGVSGGALLGYVGSTGNASASAPHLHWEYHPGGGGAVNPTPLARQLCG